jgi:hypothetical protein
MRYLEDQGFGHEGALRAWLLPNQWSDAGADSAPGFSLLLLSVSRKTGVPIADLRQGAEALMPPDARTSSPFGDKD